VRKAADCSRARQQAEVDKQRVEAERILQEKALRDEVEKLKGIPFTKPLK
jgi:hypothetical protein